jgi:eukaryotic-like serine/threonine-protein kinase
MLVPTEISMRSRSRQQIGPTSELSRTGVCPSGAPSVECATDNQILAFALGSLDERSVARIDTHLNTCRSCAALLLATLDVVGAERAAVGLRCWSLSPNSLLDDRYLIRAPLGRGGMGEVYDALDLMTGRTLALKTVRATECDDPEMERRLSAEFEFARRVRHSKVCKVYELGREGDLAYFSMDLIAGLSLAERLCIGRLDHLAVRHLARELLQGLAAIHRAGVVHRDIKSHNVMLRDADPSLIVIIDFGLAMDAHSDCHSGAPVREYSGPASLEGSPAYMAPEQFCDAAISPATDVFATGVVLFEALTGTLPFRSLNRRRGRFHRSPAEVPLRAADVAREVPEDLDAFIARCLELDCHRRYETAAEALTIIERRCAE